MTTKRDMEELLSQIMLFQFMSLKHTLLIWHFGRTNRPVFYEVKSQVETTAQARRAGQVGQAGQAVQVAAPLNITFCWVTQEFFSWRNRSPKP